MKYLLLFCGNPRDADVWEALPEETRAQQETRVGQWFAAHRSQIKSDHQLHAPYTATSVHFTPYGQPLITDGPFFEGTEVLGGPFHGEYRTIETIIRSYHTHVQEHTAEIWRSLPREGNQGAPLAHSQKNF